DELGDEVEGGGQVVELAHSGYYKHKPPEKDLIDLMFSWTLEDISNDELYKDQ
ncbi:hypothetical protein MKW98_030698, partial [Papaver atlanticum]